MVGAGAAGLVSAYIAAALKSKVGLIEKHRMGGDCLYTGCVPSKALIRSAHVAHLFQRGEEFGLQSVRPQVDFTRVFQRIQTVIKKIEPNDSVERYSGLGVECLQGQAEIMDPYRIKVGDKTMTTRNIIIAAGASPIVPPIPGLQDVKYYTSENLWQMSEAPKKLLVMGGGPIGCELAQAFGRLGCETTLVEKGERILIREDAEVSEFIHRVFKREGIKVQLGAEVVRFEKVPGEGGKALLKNGEAVVFDAVIVALGRKANVTGYGLEKLGLPIRSNGTLETDDFLRTKFHNVLACGDVTGPFQFTHAASHQAGFAVLNALFAPFKSFKADYSALPWCTYVDPEVARLGLNETEATAESIPHDVNIYEIEHLDRAICEGEGQGFVKVLTEKGKGKILGVTIVGPHAGDIMAEFVLAKRKKLSLNDILNTVHSYPTFAEANRFVAGVWKRKGAPQGALRLLQKFHTFRRR
ncbi:MAG: NAD(P)/FAD-dependent oxidoreductase [Bdellovibrionales bacterium]